MIATIAGATGLIGNYLLEELLKDPDVETVRILIRRPMDFHHPRLEKKLVDYEDNDSLLIALSNTDVLFCCIGTTNVKVKGDKEVYRKIDHDIAVKLARFSKMNGCEKYLLVSSMGADPRSNNFYTKLKGETEQDVIQTGIRSLYIMRPSMLLGERKEFRPLEKIGKILMTSLSFLVPTTYKAIHGRTVAQAMIQCAKKETAGTFIIDNKKIKEIAPG